MNKYKCLRCNHEWIPRKENPRYCPNCNSPYWNILRTRKPTVKSIKSSDRS